MAAYYGTVDKDGKKVGGSSGWECRRTSAAGCFLIQFDEKFKDTPHVVANQNNGDITGVGWDTRDGVLIVGCDSNEAKIKTGDSNGKGTYRRFSFVAMNLPLPPLPRRPRRRRPRKPAADYPLLASCRTSRRSDPIRQGFGQENRQSRDDCCEASLSRDRISYSRRRSSKSDPTPNRRFGDST